MQSASQIMRRQPRAIRHRDRVGTVPISKEVCGAVSRDVGLRRCERGRHSTESRLLLTVEAARRLRVQRLLGIRGRRWIAAVQPEGGPKMKRQVKAAVATVAIALPLALSAQASAAN